VDLVRKQTIATKRLPLVGEVSANTRILLIEGVGWSVQRISTAVNLNSLDPEPLFFSFTYVLSYTHEAEWTPFQINHFSENLVAPEIKPGTFKSVARNSDH
jgi:hypothetical protein